MNRLWCHQRLLLRLHLPFLHPLRRFQRHRILPIQALTRVHTLAALRCHHYQADIDTRVARRVGEEAAGVEDDGTIAAIILLRPARPSRATMIRQDRGAEGEPQADGGGGDRGLLRRSSRERIKALVIKEDLPENVDHLDHLHRRCQGIKTKVVARETATGRYRHLR